MLKRIGIMMLVVVACSACSSQATLDLSQSSPAPSPSPSPSPSPVESSTPASQTAFGPSTLSMSTSSNHRAVMGLVTMGSAPVSKSKNNVVTNNTLQQGKVWLGTR